MEDGVPRKLIMAAERAGWKRDSTSWAWLFSDPEAQNAVADLIGPLREADLIVGFEMPPNMIRVLNGMGLRFVDITQDPMRFCPDLFFRVRGNDPTMTARVAKWEVSDATVRTEADRLQARIVPGRHGAASVLFVGQVEIDSSLIANATLTRVDRFITEIEQELAGRALLLKPHPMAPKSQDLLTLYKNFPKSRFIVENIYALLASPTIEHVVTLSSSVAAEAPMFGKTVRQLVTPDTHALPAGIVSRFHRVDARITSTAFWGDILDGMPSFMFVENPPRPLRRYFSVRWGYSPEMTAPVSRRIAVGEEIVFAIDGRGRDLCLFGWSDPEPWGIWSDGAVAILQFDPPGDLSSFLIEIVFAPYVPDKAHTLTMTICPRAGGSLDNISRTFDSGEVTTVVVPITTLQDTGPVELLFQFPDRISPHQLGLGDDTRLLGAGLHRLTIRRAPAA